MARSRRPSGQTIAVLLALADRPSDWRHGYALCRQLGLRAGTVYPILIRLAERGLVETAWEQTPSQGRPPRHLYRLTASGRAMADDLARSEVRLLPPAAARGAAGPRRVAG